MNRCIYRYKDGARCVIMNLPDNEEMCVEHRLLTRRAAEKAKNDKKRYERMMASGGRPSRAKPKEEKVTKVVERDEPQVYDHTAPWRCGRAGCVKCSKKPTYNEYMSAKFPKEK